jgi:hypothetical protein
MLAPELANKQEMEILNQHNTKHRDTTSCQWQRNAICNTPSIDTNTQRYYKTDITSNNTDITLPVTPHVINQDQVHIGTKNPYYLWPYVIKPQITVTPTAIRHCQKAAEMQHLRCNTMTYIGIHTQQSYEQQIFTWIISQNSHPSTIQGKVQQIRSKKCAAVRGGLIGLLQAIKYLNENTRKDRTTEHDFTITICCQDKYLLNQIKSQKQNKSNCWTKIRPEQELIQEIANITDNFEKYRIHHSTKKDHKQSTKHMIIQQCINTIQTTTQYHATQYQTCGKATIMHMKEEVLDRLDETILHAAGTVDLCHYMRKKYSWSEATIETIDWYVHGQVMNSLSTRGHKTCPP